jgi:hypothetical protein
MIVWTANFKGHFRTRDGIYCYPLTIADHHTRYLLACHGLLSTKRLRFRLAGFMGRDWPHRERHVPSRLV